MSTDALPYGEAVICLDEDSPWYLQVGTIAGKNKTNVGVRYPDDPGNPATGRWHPKDKVKPVATVASDAAPFVRALNVSNGRLAVQLRIDTEGAPAPTHILLTGPNGSGKTSILDALVSSLHGFRTAHEGNPPIVEIEWVSPPAEIAAARALNQTLVVYLPAERPFRPAAVGGPTNIEWSTLLDAPQASVFLGQYVVNRRAQQAIAREEGREQEANEIADELTRFTDVLRWIFSDERASFQLARGSFDVTFALSSGRTFGLARLPAGWASVLAFWAELALREEAWRRVTGATGRPKGVVVIDEIETHLHLRLQETVLPFLTSLFPNWQFIVATHSPVVLASIPNAIVHDLGLNVTCTSASLQGVRYGSLMTSHFGLDDEYDEETTALLKEFASLSVRATSDADRQRRTELADRLTARSPTLAREVWLTQSGFAGR